MKLSKTFLNMLRRESVHIQVSEDRESVLYDGEYIAVEIRINDEQDGLSIKFKECKSFKRLDFPEYVKEINLVNKIIDSAEMIYEVETRTGQA